MNCNFKYKRYEAHHAGLDRQYDGCVLTGIQGYECPGEDKCILYGFTALPSKSKKR